MQQTTPGLCLASHFHHALSSTADSTPSAATVAAVQAVSEATLILQAAAAAHSHLFSHPSALAGAHPLLANPFLSQSLAAQFPLQAAFPFLRELPPAPSPTPPPGTKGTASTGDTNNNYHSEDEEEQDKPQNLVLKTEKKSEVFDSEEEDREERGRRRKERKEEPGEGEKKELRRREEKPATTGGTDNMAAAQVAPVGGAVNGNPASSDDEQPHDAEEAENGDLPLGDEPHGQAQLEVDKRAVYRHPLFPLLALLFEKCELATQSAECPSSESFDVDIQAFVQHQESDRKPFFVDDPEVDGLMVKAIQVLRIHLLELEKVQELCKDFCNRYITCLKGKMQSENLLRTEYTSYSNGSSSGSDTESQPPTTPQSHGTSNPATPQQVQVVNNMNSMVIQPNVDTAVSLGPGQIVSGGTVYQMVQTPQGIVAQPIQIQSTPVSAAVTAAARIVHGSTPISQIGASASSSPVANASTSTNAASERAIADPGTPTSQDEEDDYVSKKKQKRGVLPKHATSIMRSWLFQHIVHPYPTEDEKRQIAAQTNLTLLQVNNWFINARRRILQPMLDASNPDQSHKAKKAKMQSSRPAVQRFWPDNIANLQPQLSNSSSTVLSEGQTESQTAGGSGFSTADRDDENEDSLSRDNGDGVGSPLNSTASDLSMDGNTDDESSMSN